MNGRAPKLKPYAARLLIAAALFSAVRAWTSGECADFCASKKGLQVQMVDDALALGIHHAAINVNLLQLAEAGPRAGQTLVLDGTHFEFNARYVASLDEKIKPLSAHGVTVYLILLAYNTPNAELARAYIHPKFDRACPSRLSAFNTGDAAGARNFRACVTFLAQRYARADAPPVHFIVGNEVNSHWYWYNMGLAPNGVVIAEYERAVRICNEAAQCISARSRVFISLDHNWNRGATPNEPLKSFGARTFIERFAEAAKRHGDFAWNVAFHPYPENLFECRTWNDKAATCSFDTPMITFKNIEMLNDFMRRDELLCAGCPRRIILSEQGFHSSNAPDGELLQAAAFAYAYRKVLPLDGIDAFILHRHVDNVQEGGLRLGLWTGDKANHPVKKKMIYEVFRMADTCEWEKAFQFALPVIGVRGWNKIDAAH
ncbi:MAG TPA: DUF5722 domain-containing protein [Planctomycetota bacterium]|nr:DUF5722 domain-containing protein [Planctomycetota bacterium]